jgi:hypothetical protein
MAVITLPTIYAKEGYYAVGWTGQLIITATAGVLPDPVFRSLLDDCLRCLDSAGSLPATMICDVTNSGALPPATQRKMVQDHCEPRFGKQRQALLTNQLGTRMALSFMHFMRPQNELRAFPTSDTFQALGWLLEKGAFEPGPAVELLTRLRTAIKQPYSRVERRAG